MTIRIRSCVLTLGLLGCERGTSEPTDPPDVPPPSPCRGADRLETIWTDVRERELLDALSDTPGEWPRRTVETIDQRVGESGADWAVSYRTACTEQEQSRIRCLDRRADDLAALILLLIEGPQQAAQLAPLAELQLRNLDVCDHPLGPVPGPLSPTVGTELAATAIWFSLADYARAAARLEPLITLPSLVDDPSWLFTLATMNSLVDFAAGQRESAVARLTELAGFTDTVGPRERSSYEHLAALAASLDEDWPSMLAAMDRALAIEREMGDPIRVAMTLDTLAKLHASLDPDPAVPNALLSEAIGIYARELGSESAHAATAQLDLASLHAGAGRIEQAHDLLLQARDGFSAALGSDHPATHDVVLQLGRLLLAAGRPTDAYHAFLDLLEITVGQYGERHVRVADAKLELAEALRAMGEHDGARVTYLEALPILVEGHGAEHRSVAQTSIHLGLSLVELGRVAKDHDLLDEAERHCSVGRSLALALPEADPLRADADRCVSEVATARKRTGKRKRAAKP